VKFIFHQGQVEARWIK